MEVNSYSGTPKRLKTSRMACLAPKVEKGHDLSCMVTPVTVSYITDKFWTIDIRNININIRHGVAPTFKKRSKRRFFSTGSIPVIPRNRLPVSLQQTHVPFPYNSLDSVRNEEGPRQSRNNHQNPFGE